MKLVVIVVSGHHVAIHPTLMIPVPGMGLPMAGPRLLPKLEIQSFRFETCW